MNKELFKKLEDRFGEVYPPPNLRFYLDTVQTEDVDLNDFDKGIPALDKLLFELGKKSYGKIPMLIWKRKRKRWLACLPTDQLVGEYAYRIVYDRFSIVNLESLLVLGDYFWFE